CGVHLVVDGGPVAAAVDTLEDADARARRVEGGGVLGVDRQGDATACGVQPGVDGAPVAAAVDALEDAAAGAGRVEGGGCLGVDRQGIDPDCLVGSGQPRVHGAPLPPAAVRSKPP